MAAHGITTKCQHACAVVLMVAMLLAPAACSNHGLDQGLDASSTTSTTTSSAAPTTSATAQGDVGSGSGSGSTYSDDDGAEEDDTPYVSSSSSSSSSVTTQPTTAPRTPKPQTPSAPTTPPTTTTGTTQASQTTTTTTMNATFDVLPMMSLTLAELDYTQMDELEVLTLKADIIKKVVNKSSGLLKSSDVLSVILKLVEVNATGSDGQAQQEQQRHRRSGSNGTHVNTEADIIFKAEAEQFVTAAAVLVNQAIEQDALEFEVTVQGTPKVIAINQAATIGNAGATPTPGTTTRTPDGDIGSDGASMSTTAVAVIAVFCVIMVLVIGAAMWYHSTHDPAQSCGNGVAPGGHGSRKVRRSSMELRNELAAQRKYSTDQAGLMESGRAGNGANVDAGSNTSSFYEEKQFTVKEGTNTLQAKSVKRENPAYGLQYN